MLQHVGFDEVQLGPQLARLLAANSPLPAREMVARGLAPLVGSATWMALYQLWVRGSPALADQAGRTASELPTTAVMEALADPHLAPVLVDFMARRQIRNPETLRLLVHHPRIHDTTLLVLARCAPAPVCEAIARNQRRWLAMPTIAEQLVRNPCCDRVTAHAVLELGAREAVAGLAELRHLAVAGANLHDDPETHAKATAWMLRSGPRDPFPGLALGPPPKPPRGRNTARALHLQQLSPRHQHEATAPTAMDLTPVRPVLILAPENPVVVPLVPARPPRHAWLNNTDDGTDDDALDLSLPDEVVQTSMLARRPAPTPEASRPQQRLAQVLDTRTSLPRALSLLHRLRGPELRRVAANVKLAPALRLAARRRLGPTEDR